MRYVRHRDGVDIFQLKNSDYHREVERDRKNDSVRKSKGKSNNPLKCKQYC